MKRYVVLFTLLLGLAAFMFAQANSSAAQSQSSQPAVAAPQAPSAPSAPTTPNDADDDHGYKGNDQTKDAHDVAAQDQQSTPAPEPRRDQDRDRDRDQNQVQNQNTDRDRDRDNVGVYDRDQVYQDQDRRDQQDRDRDRDANRDRDVNRDRDANRDRDNDHDRDLDRDRDRNRVGVGGDVQSQIYSALRNDSRFSNVNVAVVNNRVDLTGTVPTGADRNEVMRIAQQYANGMSIRDHLKVSGRGRDHDRDDHK